tara:strand:+ start:726 stop:1133 length:408 start_codon:yes stop_codon:yes gene_type:complete
MARKRPEQALQIAVAKYLAHALRPPTYWTSVDAGAGKMTAASAGLRKARGVKAGFPDIIVMHPMGLNTLVVGIELKAGKGKLSPAQIDACTALFDANARYIECRSLDEVEGCLRWAGIPMHASLPGAAPDRKGAA